MSLAISVYMKENLPSVLSAFDNFFWTVRITYGDMFKMSVYTMAVISVGDTYRACMCGGQPCTYVTIARKVCSTSPICMPS